MSKNNGNLANEKKVHKKKRKQVNVYDMLFNSRRKRKTRFSIENVGLAKTNSMQHSNNNSDSSSFKHIIIIIIIIVIIMARVIKYSNEIPTIFLIIKKIWKINYK